MKKLWLLDDLEEGELFVLGRIVYRAGPRDYLRRTAMPVVYENGSSALREDVKVLPFDKSVCKVVGFTTEC